MLQSLQFNAIASLDRIDAETGVIRGVCVLSKGEAKGHGLMLDDTSLDQFLDLAVNRKDGIKVRFGADHDAGASDINGALKHFRRDQDKIRADLHLLKTDKNFAKVIEMAETLPNEFGLSASTSADEELIGHDKFVRFNEIFCVDIVSNPAATKGLFFSQTNNNKQTDSMIKEFAAFLGLPETATEADVKLALAAKCKLEDEAKEKAEKEKKEKELQADDEEKGKQGKKFAAEIEAIKAEFSAKFAAVEAANKAAAEAAHKAEVEALKLEASKDGKVIPMNDEALLKLSMPEIKDLIGKLPKGQLKLSRGTTVPVNKDGKAITDKRSPEFKAFLMQKQAEGALALGQRIMGQNTLNQN